MIYTTFASLFLFLQTPAQPAQPALQPELLVDQWFIRLNALDDWYITVNGKDGNCFHRAGLMSQATGP